MRSLWLALAVAGLIVGRPTRAATQTRPTRSVDDDAIRKGRARLDMGLDVDGPDRRYDIGDFAVEMKVLGGPTADFTPGDFAAFPPPRGAANVAVPDSARVLIRSTADGRTWVILGRQSQLPVGKLRARRVIDVLGFVVPQLPGGDYAVWYEPGQKPDSAEHLRITPQLESSFDGGRTGWTITVLAMLIGPGTLPPRADAPAGPTPYQADITLKANNPNVADLASDQPATVRTAGTIARFKVALRDAGVATFSVTARDPGAAAAFSTATITVHAIKPNLGAETWLPLLRYNGRIHYGRPDRPAVLLVHGYLGHGGGWMGPGEDVGNPDESNYDYRNPPPNKFMGDSNAYPGVGLEGFGLSLKTKLTNDDYWFNYLASHGFTVATWDQPGTRFDTALVSARLALTQFLADTKNMSQPPPIALIGHSRGGLIIRRLLIDMSAGKTRLDGDAARIAWVITLSTPHNGTVIGTLAADVENALGDLRTYERVGLGWPINLVARDQVMQAMQPYLEEMRGAEELVRTGPLIQFLTAHDHPLDGVRYYTFAGTNPTMTRLYGWSYTAASADPHGLPPRFSWRAVPAELGAISPMVDHLPAILTNLYREAGRAVPEMKEFTAGQGDGAVAVANANLPWSTAFKTFPLNHFEIRWSRAVQDDVFVYLTQPITAKASLAAGAHTGVPTTVTFHAQDFFGAPLQAKVRIAKDPAEYPTDTPIPYTFHAAPRYASSAEAYSFTLLTSDNRSATGSFEVPLGKLKVTVDPGPDQPPTGTVTVTAVDAQSGVRVPGAMVKVNGATQFPANAPYSYTFTCRKVGRILRGVRQPPECDHVMVSAPDYGDARAVWIDTEPE